MSTIIHHLRGLGIHGGLGNLLGICSALGNLLGIHSGLGNLLGICSALGNLLGTHSGLGNLLGIIKNKKIEFKVSSKVSTTCKHYHLTHS